MGVCWWCLLSSVFSSCHLCCLCLTCFFLSSSPSFLLVVTPRGPLPPPKKRGGDDAAPTQKEEEERKHHHLRGGGERKHQPKGGKEAVLLCVELLFHHVLGLVPLSPFPFLGVAAVSLSAFTSSCSVTFTSPRGVSFVDALKSLIEATARNEQPTWTQTGKNYGTVFRRSGMRQWDALPGYFVTS